MTRIDTPVVCEDAPASVGDIPTGMVFDIERYATHDGPGTRTTVFLKGCYLRCAWCHNPESEHAQPEIMYEAADCIGCLACYRACEHEALYLTDWDGRRLTVPRDAQVEPQIDTQNARGVYAVDRCVQCGACVEACYPAALKMVGDKMSVDAVMAQVRLDKPFYARTGGGITVSGGEPLFQASFTQALLKTCHEEGIHTALDTTAFGRWEPLAATIEHADLVLLDLKSMDPIVHKEYTGVDNESILANARRLAVAMADRPDDEFHGIWVRMPLIPDINDSDAQLDAAAHFIAESLAPAVRVVELLGYHTLGGAKRERLGLASTLPEIASPAPDVLRHHGERVADQLAGTGIDVRWR
mgnify:FL=1